MVRTIIFNHKFEMGILCCGPKALNSGEQSRASWASSLKTMNPLV